MRIARLQDDRSTQSRLAVVRGGILLSQVLLAFADAQEGFARTVYR